MRDYFKTHPSTIKIHGIYIEDSKNQSHQFTEWFIHSPFVGIDSFRKRVCRQVSSVAVAMIWHVLHFGDFEGPHLTPMKRNTLFCRNPPHVYFTVTDLWTDFTKRNTRFFSFFFSCQGKKESFFFKFKAFLNLFFLVSKEEKFVFFIGHRSLPYSGFFLSLFWTESKLLSIDVPVA